MPLGASRFGLLGGVAETIGLIHISTQTADGTTNSITFNNIQNDTYRTQLFVFSGGSTTSSTRLDMQLSADNGSTFISSANYKSATIFGNNKTVNTQGNGSADTRMTYVVSSDNSSTAATTVGYMIFSNWYDSSKYSTTVGGNIGFNSNDTSIYRAHISKTLALTASHNAFRVFTNNTSANIRSGTTMSLYGLV